MLGTGLMAQFGGGTPTANLNNFGSDYQRFYIHQSDTAAATWLGETYNGYSPVFVDRYATLHLTVPTTITKGLVNDVTPETIARGAYVYAGYTNVVDNTAMSFWNGKTVEYQFPEVFIKSHKNTLYSNGKAEIYR